MSSRTIDPLPLRTQRSAAKRLRIVSSIVTFFLAVWLFYPVEVYHGHIPAYLAVATIDGKPEFAGVVKAKNCEHPILAACELATQSHPRFLSQPLAGGRCFAHWSVHPKGQSPGTLSWKIRNLVWTLEPADPFGNHARGSPDWTRAMIESADTAMASFREGTLKSSQVTTKRTSLGVILLERAVATLRERW